MRSEEGEDGRNERKIEVKSHDSAAAQRWSEGEEERRRRETGQE